MTSTSMEAFCDQAKILAGGNTDLAKTLGQISSQAVSQWLRVPPERVLDVERATGLSRHLLRPDVFGPWINLNKPSNSADPQCGCCR